MTIKKIILGEPGNLNEFLEVAPTDSQEVVVALHVWYGSGLDNRFDPYAAEIVFTCGGSRYVQGSKNLEGESIQPVESGSQALDLLEGMVPDILRVIEEYGATYRVDRLNSATSLDRTG